MHNGIPHKAPNGILPIMNAPIVHPITSGIYWDIAVVNNNIPHIITPNIYIDIQPAQTAVPETILKYFGNLIKIFIFLMILKIFITQ